MIGLTFFVYKPSFMADNIISLGFNYDELTTEQKNVIALLDQVLDKTKQLNGIQMNPGTDGLVQFGQNLAAQRDAIAALTATYPQLTAAQTANNAAQIEAAKLAEARAKQMAAEERLVTQRANSSRQSTTQNEREAAAAAKAANAYLQLRKAYEEAALEAKRLQTIQLTNPSEAGAASAAAMTAEAQRLHGQLTTIEQSVGQYNRNVGNYTSALTGYANTLRGLRGPTKLLGEALGIGAQQADQLRLVLEHSLQGLAAFFRGKAASAEATAADTAAQAANTTANTENTSSGLANAAAQRTNAVATGEAATAQGYFAGVTGTATGALRVFRIAIASLGIGLIVAGIASVIYLMTRLSDAAKDAAMNHKLLAEMNEEAAKSGGKEQAQLEITRAELESENVSRKTKLQLVKDLKEEYPAIFAQYSTEEILLGKVANAYDLAAAAIIRKAQAQAASGKIEELAGKQLDLELKKQQDAAETNNKIRNEKSGDRSVGYGSVGSSGGNSSQAYRRGQDINDYNDRQKGRQKEYDDAQKQIQFLLKFATNGANETVKIDKAAKDKKVKTDKDTSFEILENARKTSFEIRQIEEKSIADKLKRQANDKDNSVDERIDLLLQASLKEQQIILAEADFEKNAIDRALEYRLQSTKNNENEIIALRAEAIGKKNELDVLQQKASVKQGEQTVDTIKNLEEEAAKATKKTYDDTQKAAMSDLERRARIMEDDNKAKAKKPKEVKKKDFSEKYADEISETSSGLDIIQTLVDARYDREENRIKQKMTLLDISTEKEIAGINASTLSNQEKAAQILIAEKTAASQKEALQRQQRVNDEKKAKFDRDIAILKVTAGIAIDLVDGNYAGAVLGGAELVKLIATPIPHYAEGAGIEGRPVHIGGLAVVGERTDKVPEKVTLPSGKSFIASSPMMLNLPYNTKVQPLLDNAVQNLGDTAISNQFVAMAKLNNMMDIKVQMGEKRMVDGIVSGLAYHLNEINGTFKKQKPPIINNIKDMSAFYAYKDSQTKR